MPPPAHLGWYHVTVRATRQLTPRMTRITLTGDDLARFIDAGPDQRFKLFLPRPGQKRPQVPTGADWYQRWQAMPADVRPIMRTYTVRAARPDAAELDVDFALHRNAGPATEWAGSARPGDRVSLYGMRSDFAPPPDTDAYLLAGDETAIPAIGAILERLPETANIRTYIEISSPDERQDLGRPSSVTWLHRSETSPGTSPLLDAVRAAKLPGSRPYAWLAGESGVVTGLRRYLVRDRALPTTAVTFCGYWRLGSPIDET